MDDTVRRFEEIQFPDLAARSFVWATFSRDRRTPRSMRSVNLDRYSFGQMSAAISMAPYRLGVGGAAEGGGGGGGTRRV